MGKIDDIEKRSVENPTTPLNDPDDWLYEALGSGSRTSGVRVNHRSALGLAPFLKCVNLISRGVAKVQPHCYRLLADGGKVIENAHPAERVLSWPCEYYPSMVVRQTLTAHAVTRGNGYAHIERDGRGRPTAMLPLNPDNTYPVRSNGVLYYTTGVDNTPIRLDSSEVFHVRGLSFDGLSGYDVVTLARETLGLGIASRTHGSSYFGNDASPGVILTYPGKLSDKARANILESWDRKHKGPLKKSRTAVLEEGMTADTFGDTARDAMLTEVWDAVATAVANILHVPPHKVGLRVNSSYGSLEQEQQDYLDECLDYWLCSWEAEAEMKLLTEQEKFSRSHSIQFPRRKMVRTTFAAQAEALNKLVQGGILNTDEARDDLDFNPRPDGTGKTFYAPVNLAPVSATPPEPTPKPARNVDLEAARAALQEQVRADSTRLVRRIGAQAERAAKKPGEFLAFIEKVTAENAETIKATFAPPSALARSLGFTPGELATEFSTAIVTELLSLAGRRASGGLGDGVAEWTESYQASAAARFAELIVKEGV